MANPGSFSSRATERQKEYAKQLGIVFSDEITRAEISKLIDEAVFRMEEKRYEELNKLEQRESHAWQEVRAKVLAEIDADPKDCRLSRADSSKIVEELSRRGFAAVLITIPWDDFDPVNLVGVSGKVSFSDDMSLSDAKRIVVSSAITFLNQDGFDVVSIMEKSSNMMNETSQLLRER